LYTYAPSEYGDYWYDITDYIGTKADIVDPSQLLELTSCQFTEQIPSSELSLPTGVQARHYSENEALSFDLR